MKRLLLAVLVMGVAASMTWAESGKEKKADKKEKKAAETVLVGEAAPDFTLKDVDGKEHTLSNYIADEKVVVLEWFNPDCPFVKKHHKTFDSMSSTYSKFKEENVVWLAINSGAPGKQGHGVERNQKAREEYGMAYPVLLDEDGKVGKMYGAKRTPQIFVIQGGTVVYDGPLDDVQSPAELGKKNYVGDVLEQCCDGKAVDPQKVKAYGCTVKYAS